MCLPLDGGIEGVVDSGYVGSSQMNNLLSHLRSRIALLLLLSIAPLAALAVYLAVDGGRKDAVRAQANSHAAVRLVSQDINRLIQTSSDLVLGLSRTAAIRELGQSCNDQLAALKSAFPQFANLVVVGPDRTVLCAASNPTRMRAISDSPTNLALMQRVQRSRRAVVGTFFLSRPGRRSLPIMGPVFDERGEMRAYLYVTVDLDWLQEQVERVTIPPEAVLLVMDGQGTEIARNPPTPDWPIGAPAPSLERTLVGASDFDGEVRGYDGIDRFYSLAQVRPGEDLLVVMRIRSSVIYGPARRQLSTNLLGLASVGLIVLGLTWMASDRYLTRPLSRLIQAANQLASGTLGVRTGLPYQGEIGELAQSFDRMADGLERNQVREKQAVEQDAARLNRLKKLAGFSMTLAGDPSAVLERMVQMLAEAFDVPGVFIAEIAGNRLLLRAGYGAGHVTERTGGWPLEGTPCATVAADKQIHIYDRVQQQFPKATYLRSLHAHSWCGFPSLDGQDNVVAVTSLIDTRPREFGEEDRQILLVVGQRIAAEVERARALAERNRAEQELRESQRRYEEAQQLAHVGSYTSDVLSGEMEWSAELYRIYELGPRGQSPSREVVLVRTHPDDRALIHAKVQELLRNHGNFGFEHRLVMPDGRVKWVEVTGTVYAGPDGRPRTRGTVQDITERKRAGQEKERLEAQLHQAHKMESIGRLAGGIAHDFNNLLTVINGYSHILTHQLEWPVRKYAEQIRQAGESAANLTRQLLAFSRMEAAQPHPVQLNTIVTEARDMLARLVGAQVDIHTSLHASPDSVLADPYQMQQCLMNLVVNARDAMPNGGQLTIETGNDFVPPNELPAGGNGVPGPHVRLTVRDTGIGMDNETVERMFDPFFTTKERGSGTGLGLSTVYGIVSRWRGFLRVRTEVGKGSEFNIFFPLNQTAGVAEAEQAGGSGPSPLASATVLIAEDQDMVRDFVAESLAASGYTVLQARNAAEALDLIRKHRAAIRLLLSDVMMPGMRGDELARRVAAISPGTKVLLMTGYSEDAVCEDSGVELLMKPFSPEDLESRVRDLLRIG